MGTVKRGEYQLAEQSGSLGYFAKVEVHVTDGGFANDLSLYFTTQDHPWTAAISFGVAYAWEHFSRAVRPTTGITVQVVDVQWQPSDTTTAGMAYVSALALWNALAFRPRRGALFDIESASFCFPN